MTASTMTTASPTRTEPPRPVPPPDCPLCPRLAAFRQASRAAEPGWHNAPVGSFGPADAPLVIVGLAPGLRGANRTGRPFTGDYAGEVLYPALLAHGLARGRFAADPEDGLELVGARIANAVRCVPPQNKPTPAEIATCNRFLVPELTVGVPPRVILALGRVAHAAALRALGIPASRSPLRPRRRAPAADRSGADRELSHLALQREHRRPHAGDVRRGGPARGGAGRRRGVRRGSR